MSVLPAWIRPSVPGSAAKCTCQNLPGACNTSLELSQQKKLMHEKKILLRARKCVTLTT